MERRRASRVACLAALAFALSGCGGDAPTAQHLLLISIDTLRADHLGSHGAERDTSPHLDQLAAEGILFEQARATAPWTLPSHASMLTGLYPTHHGSNLSTRGLHPGARTLAEHLRDSGFTTGAVVNVFFLSDDYGFDRGFESFQRVPESHAPEGAAEQITDLGLAWWRAAGDARRFLLLHYFDVHSDYGAVPEIQRRFAPEEGRLSGTTAEIMGLRAHPERASAADVARLEALYDAGILQLDAEIGRLLRALDQRGDLDETLIIVTSDHGEEFADHGNFSHGHTHYRELLHVPLIVRAPGAPQRVRIETPVSLVDIVPTALAGLGQGVPEGLNGVDLAPLWRGAALPPRDLFAEAGPGLEKDLLRSIRHGRLKLIRGPDGAELYDVVADPHEQRDLAAARPEDVARLLARIEAHDRAAGTAGGVVGVTPEKRERLRALGYLEPGEPASP